jgi:hypothetical protein
MKIQNGFINAKRIKMKRSIHKAVGGLIRIALDASDVIRDIRITGDFFFYPEEAIELLEKELVGVRAREEDILNVITNFYKKNNIEALGLRPEDFVKAIKKAL